MWRRYGLLGIGDRTLTAFLICSSVSIASKKPISAPHSRAARRTDSLAVEGYQAALGRVCKTRKQLVTAWNMTDSIPQLLAARECGADMGFLEAIETEVWYTVSHIPSCYKLFPRLTYSTKCSLVSFNSQRVPTAPRSTRMWRRYGLLGSNRDGRTDQERCQGSVTVTSCFLVLHTLPSAAWYPSTASESVLAIINISLHNRKDGLAGC
jgi:hypothetical protein